MIKCLSVYIKNYCRLEEFSILIPVEIIAERLSQFGALVAMPKKSGFKFGGIQMLSSSTTDMMDKNVLYICDIKTLRKLPKAKSKDICFLLCSSEEKISKLDPDINVLVFSEELAIYDVLNHLLWLFNFILETRRKLQVAVSDKGGLEALAEVSRFMFGDAIMVVVDSVYSVILNSHDEAQTNAYVDKILKDGYYDKKTLQSMAQNGYFDLRAKHGKAESFEAPNVSGVPVITREFTHNNIFFSFATLYFVGEEPSVFHAFLFDEFTTALDKYFARSGFYESVDIKHQKMIDDLLNSEEMTNDLFLDRVQSLRLEPEGNFRLAYIEMQEVSISKSIHLSTCLQKWSNSYCMGVFEYNDGVMMFFRDWHYCSVAEKYAFMDSWNDLMEVLADYNAKIGVSLLFTDMRKLKSAYNQARAALKLGNKLKPEKREYCYSEYSVYDMLQKYSESFMLEDISVQYLDQLLDKESDPYGNIILLYQYISCERNISLTAKKMHMHRNSVIYRLQKIQDILRIDLSKRDVRLRLMLSFKILELEGKLVIEDEVDDEEDELN